MLRIAIAKGRLMDSLINYLDAIEFTTLSETLKNRERQLLLSVDNIECILVKGVTCQSMWNKELQILVSLVATF